MAAPPEAVPPVTEWMEADYFERPRSLRRWHPFIGWLILLAAGIAVAATLWPGTPTAYQSGKVSASHAMFNDQCQVCHTEAFRTTQRLLPGPSHISTVADEACQRCHAGALHNEQQVFTPGCGTCHHEHQGRNILARVADSYCTDCHADLKRKDGAPSTYAHVSDFGAHHPEFAFWRDGKPTDPGRLNFNHQVHLATEGIPGGNGQVVKLDCQSCHQPDSERRYMRPVTYTQNCAGCHPLSVQLAGKWKEPAALKAAEEYRKQPAPHKMPMEVRAEVRDRLLTLASRVPSLRDSAAAEPDERPLPGQPPAAAGTMNSAAWAEKQLKVAERMLFLGAAGCAFCHIQKPATTSLANALPVYEPTRQPQRWLTHGGFSHNSHRMLLCADCHPAAESRQTADVLIPHIATCQKCHNPQVGARSDCSNCHHYHDHRRDSDWKGRFTIEESLGR